MDSLPHHELTRILDDTPVKSILASSPGKCPVCAEQTENTSLKKRSLPRELVEIPTWQLLAYYVHARVNTCGNCGFASGEADIFSTKNRARG